MQSCSCQRFLPDSDEEPPGSEISLLRERFCSALMSSSALEEGGEEEEEAVQYFIGTKYG